MISLQTPDGKKNFILRGILTPDGAKGIAMGRITTPDGDLTFWDSTTVSVSVTLDTAYVTGAVSSIHSVAATTNTATATATGGSEPYSYAWTLESSTGGTWSILSPISAATAFRCSSLAAGTSETATFKLTVTAANGSVGEATVFAECENLGGF